MLDRALEERIQRENAQRAQREKDDMERERREVDGKMGGVGGGSNAIGLFYPFLEDKQVRCIGVEAGGHGILAGQHAARFQGGSLGVLQGARTFILQDSNGQIMNTHSISAGLDYAAVGPEHSYLRDQARVEYTFCTDDEALKAFCFLSETEGIIPAMESAHAIAETMKLAPTLRPDQTIIANLSGRGDKDVQQVAAVLGI